MRTVAYISVFSTPTLPTSLALVFILVPNGMAVLFHVFGTMQGSGLVIDFFGQVGASRLYMVLNDVLVVVVQLVCWMVPRQQEEEGVETSPILAASVPYYTNGQEEMQDIVHIDVWRAWNTSRQDVV
jgi:hypothetical protein